MLQGLLHALDIVQGDPGMLLFDQVGDGPAAYMGHAFALQVGQVVFPAAIGAHQHHIREDGVGGGKPHIFAAFRGLAGHGDQIGLTFAHQLQGMLP